MDLSSDRSWQRPVSTCSSWWEACTYLVKAVEPPESIDFSWPSASKFNECYRSSEEVQRRRLGVGTISAVLSR
jgi:hypothetical protein